MVSMRETGTGRLFLSGAAALLALTAVAALALAADRATADTTGTTDADYAGAPLSAVAQLGKKLFFDVRLSASGRQSCASCHDPRTAYAPDNDLAVQLGGALQLSSKVGVGTTATLILPVATQLPKAEAPRPVAESAAANLFDAFDDIAYAAGGAAGDTVDLVRPPVRTIRDTYPIYSSIAVDTRYPQTVYAGTDRGVIRSLDGGRSWDMVNSVLGGHGRQQHPQAPGPAGRRAPRPPRRQRLERRRPGRGGRVPVAMDRSRPQRRQAD